MDKEYVDIAIVGGGSAGLAAAISAYNAGCQSIVVLEREEELGGILNQCIHNGFGLHTFHEELTGPEYADRYIQELLKREISYYLDTTVIDISAEKLLTVVSPERGLYQIQAKAVVLAMGCRERPRGALPIVGTRPAGVFSAGQAQRLVNIDGLLPGKEIVILGSGDIGLIMARRLTLEGAHVICVTEIMDHSGGLQRNIVQCLNDFDIPLLLSHTVTSIEGHDRVSAVTIAEVDEHLRPIAGSEKRYECDTLILSVGLLPENELSALAGVAINPKSRGAYVNESFETNVTGIFAAGNVLHVHDLVDFVSEEASLAGRAAARFAHDALETQAGPQVEIEVVDPIRYSVPARIRPNMCLGDVVLRFRVQRTVKNAVICAEVNGELIAKRKVSCALPAEMQELKLKKELLESISQDTVLTLSIQEASV